MVNPFRGEAAVTIGGKDRTLRYDSNAIATLEDMLGVDTSKLFENFGILRVRAFLFVGLTNSGNRKLTIREVGDMLDPGEIKHYADAIMVAFGRYMGEDMTEGDDADPFEKTQEVDAA